MDPLLNPYQPGAGRRPREIAGRDEQLLAFEVAIERCELGFGERGRILSGLRGVGKTVLLNEFESMAARRGWITAKLEASRGRSVLGLLGQSLYRSLRVTAGREGHQKLLGLLRVFKSFTLNVDPQGSYQFGIEVAPAVGRADTGNADVDLAELLDELGRTTLALGRGALILIDEMQEVAPAELAALNTAFHAVGQGADPLPVLIVGAGLPSLPEVLSTATSYAERLYEYSVLGPLDAQAAHDALTKPAADLEVQWSPAALAVVDNFARGYPYFIQTGGKFGWDYAAGSPITAEDTTAGLAAAQREIDAGLYRVRWQRATPQQRDLMRAVAGLGGDAGATMSAVSAELGKERTKLSVARDQLIKKGLIYAPERGRVAFTVPGMASYVLRQLD
jgi:hypothetical protein